MQIWISNIASRVCRRQGRVFLLSFFLLSRDLSLSLVAYLFLIASVQRINTHAPASLKSRQPWPKFFPFFSFACRATVAHFLSFPPSTLRSLEHTRSGRAIADSPFVSLDLLHGAFSDPRERGPKFSFRLFLSILFSLHSRADSMSAIHHFLPSHVSFLIYYHQPSIC